MKAKSWYIRFPGDAYAFGPVTWSKPVGEDKVRAYARIFDGCQTLPKGFECWPTTDRENA